MKLISKLTLFVTLSKLAVVLLFVFTLPYLIGGIARDYTDSYLLQQKQKVLEVVTKNGVNTYLQGKESYGSYTMLAEEYISLEPTEMVDESDTIFTAERIIESDTLNYRVLTHAFLAGEKKYLMEVGKTIATIDQYNRPLQKIATYVLLGLILFTLIIDLFYTRFLLRPLGKIIRTKISNRKFPFNENSVPIRTTTTDFSYLDTSLINLMQQIHEAFEKEREFTANASHELMTPIGILQNKIENLMGEPEVGEMVQERLIGMQRTLNRLKRIVHSLLLISRIENDQFSKNESISMYELFDDIQEEISHRLNDKEITMEVDISKNIVLKAINRDLIFQLMYNLINNAIRYNKQNGTIRISDKMMADGGCAITISDTGIGIPDEDIGTIFNRFKKANKSEEAGGYGLGLSIVKSIADYHAITISLSSEVNNGTEFVINFPCELVQ
ncbi:sensor histidine kinase [Daejeonella lutea]|uniref:histidine kinase n=1 Tax=Daejeonella lutea TaxID=572036 RepID=A0A1T5DT06_9SPHI|nr:HAMP domain-containing sensor histidine kinase [Daejeonella lutea]SKB74640.1 Signal transduction histidine kinase [Daejeonella lutea]